MSLTSMHNDYLDPDRYAPDEEDEDSSWEVTPKQQKSIDFLRRKADRLRSTLFKQENRRILTVKELFEWCPDEDFSFDGEPEDVGNAWCCGESDCEQQWHQSIQVIEIGRKDGKTWFIVLEDSFAGDGDYQPCAGWDEREGDEITDDLLADLWFHLEGRTIDHFHGWALYWLDVASTGRDPLDNFYTPPTAESAIKAARRNIKYLEDDVRRLKKQQQKDTQP